MNAVTNIVVENRRPSMVVVPGKFSLVPGENEVPLPDWTEFKKTKTCTMLLHERVIVERADLKRATPLVENLQLVEEGKAVAIVEKCTATSLLKIWARKDGRSRVQKAIQQRLGVLAVPTSESADEEPTEQNTAPDNRGKQASKG